MKFTSVIEEKASGGTSGETFLVVRNIWKSGLKSTSLSPSCTTFLGPGMTKKNA